MTRGSRFGAVTRCRRGWRAALEGPRRAFMRVLIWTFLLSWAALDALGRTYTWVRNSVAVGERKGPASLRNQSLLIIDSGATSEKRGKPEVKVKEEDFVVFQVRKHLSAWPNQEAGPRAKEAEGPAAPRSTG